MNTKSETRCTTDDIPRQVEKHVFGKDERRMSDQSPFGRKSTPLMISRAFAVVFSRMSFRIRCPVLKCLSLRSTTKRLRSMGSQCCSFCLKMYDCVRPSMAPERVYKGFTKGLQRIYKGGNRQPHMLG